MRAFILFTFTINLFFASVGFSQELNTTTEKKEVLDASDFGEKKSVHYIIREKFEEGNPIWMTPVLICFILGLAVALERIITLNLATVNRNKFLIAIESKFKDEGIESATQFAKETKGPVAAIVYQGFRKVKNGLEKAEKAMENHGNVEMSKMEKGLVWLSLFITIAPMLGFLGTVIGMIQAFDAIELEGDISPSHVAGGIKVALITTVAGLIVAIVLQLFYNYCANKIDSLAGDMEEATITFTDIVSEND